MNLKTHQQGSGIEQAELDWDWNFLDKHNEGKRGELSDYDDLWTPR